MGLGERTSGLTFEMRRKSTASPNQDSVAQCGQSQPGAPDVKRRGPQDATGWGAF